MKISIDLNCDIGEGMPHDAEIMPFISSANIATGAHAGNEDTIRQTMALCKQYGVLVGAHPSFYDRENFGRLEQNLSADEIFDLVFQQLTSFKLVADEMQIQVRHVKPHGALYNLSAKNPAVAANIAKAILAFDKNLVLYGLAGSHSLLEAEKLGLVTASEVFADRTYQPDGSLTSRNLPNSVIKNEENALNQVIEMIENKYVTAITGEVISIKAETICLHGDGLHAVQFAKKINEMFVQKGIDIRQKS